MSNVSIKLNHAALRALDQAAVRALELTAEALHTEVVQAQVMPFDQGHLQNDSTFVDTSQSASGHTEIVSATPYARRLYFHPEYHFSREENPHAGGRWFDPWLPGGEQEDFAGKTFKQFYRQEAGV